MARMLVCDRNGHVTVDIEAEGAVLGDALEHEQAPTLVRCAVLMALSALAEGDDWPSVALRELATFMTHMRDAVLQRRLS
jgi:hypothetical protein